MGKRTVIPARGIVEVDLLTGATVEAPVSQSKPKCKLIGTDGNVFALMGRVESCLKTHGMKDKAVEMQQRIWGKEGQEGAQSYEEALRIMMDYVEVE